MSEGVASELQGTGISFAVIERELVGGECPYWGCIPSKTLLRSAEVLAEAARARELAASRVEWDVDFAKIAKRTHYISRDEDDTKATEALVEQGATIIRGEGRLTGPATVVVGDRTLTARRGIVIGTGTSAAIPPIEGLDGVAYWTNREATLTRELPRSLLVLGSGPIGAELAQAFARFGTEVHVIEALDRLIPARSRRRAPSWPRHSRPRGSRSTSRSRRSRSAQAEDGITVHLQGGSMLTGERLLVAVGRPSQAAGHRPRRRWDRAPRRRAGSRSTTAPSSRHPASGPGGDITGIGAFTHLSWYHGKLIGRQLKGEQAVADHRAIPRVTFTDPEIASVGLSEANARKQLSDVRVVSADSGNGTRGYINGPPGGVIKLVADMQRRVLVGALVVGPRGRRDDRRADARDQGRDPAACARGHAARVPHLLARPRRALPAARRLSTGVDAGAALQLADWRRQVGELYAQVRALGAGEQGWDAWRAGKQRLYREHPQSPVQARSASCVHASRASPTTPRCACSPTLVPVTPRHIDGDGEVPGMTHIGTLRFAARRRRPRARRVLARRLRGRPVRSVRRRDIRAGRRTAEAATRSTPPRVRTSAARTGRVVLDFNFAYAPSCAHDARWRCPLAPPANRLRVAVRAGEIGP